MGRIGLRISLVAALLAIGSHAGWAQEKPAEQTPATQKPADTRVAAPVKPLQPLTSTTEEGRKPSNSENASQDQSASAGQFRQTLSGAELYTLDQMGLGHDYFIPAFQVSESGDTNPLNQYGSSTLESVTTLGAAFALNHVWSHYSFAANYSGEGFIYNQNPSISTSAHTLTFSQTISGERSSLLLADVVSYLPESSFGYSQFNQFGSYNIAAGNLLGNIPGLKNNYITPNQSILTGKSSRISNTALGQYNYNLSSLSSLTLTGGYALLQFPNSNLVDSSVGIFGLGYNHSISPKSTIAVNYLGSLFRYDNQPGNGFTNHVFVLMYGYQVSHLLSLHLGGGPQVDVFSNGSNGNTDVSWYGTASLSYSLPRTRFSLSYRHYTTAGAGVFLGSKTDQLDLGIGRQITRMWTGSVNLGYSFNQQLQATSGSPTFNSWYATASLLRNLGRYMSMFLAYSLQQQSSSVPFCTTSSCGSFYTRSFFSVGFNWHGRTFDATENMNQE